MSIRSGMSSHNSGRLPSVLEHILSLREGSQRCPPDVERALNSIPHFRIRIEAGPSPSAHPSPGPSPGSRFGNLSHQNRSTWRQSGATEDGFEQVTPSNRRRPTPNRNHYGSGTSPSDRSVSDSPIVRPEPTVPRFSSASIKASGDVEDRMMARIKGKINKIGFSTYEATKAFMQQILSGDETEFLDEFMKFVFQKAATEPAFCALYAKLLHELADEFGHIRTVMNKLFADYLDIFTEAEMTSVPEEGTSVYRAFVEAQERKKFRRGYSQFVAELVKLGEADKDAFGRMIVQIVTVLEALHTNAANTLLCEEYIDCLNHMCLNASAIMVEASWSANVLQRITALTKKSKADMPGLTNKARFALMDLTDAAGRGWK